MIFQDRYNQLNKAQKEAVDTIEGPVMVVAGPGTGKTEILALRIANILLKTDTPAAGILALTFTEAGAKEMKKRLRKIIGSRADEVRVHTYHGFAASIISEFDDHFPHLSRAKQLTEVEAEALMREILKEPKFGKLRPLGDPEFYVSKILSTIGDAKKEAWTPAMIQAFATEETERIKTDENSLSTRGPTKGQLKAEFLKRIEKCERTVLFADVYAAYENKKQELRKIDFDDLIFEMLLTLKRDELLLRMLQEKFLYILVDEHQDTNDSQNALIHLIADFFDQPNLFIVGDEKQAIYRFQGASVENFLHLQNIWKTMKIIPLENNYRSHQQILDMVFPMIENNYDAGQLEHLRIRLRSEAKDAPRPIELVTAGNTEAAELYLVNTLNKIQQQEPLKTVAVITRLNRDVQRVLSLLERNNIPAAAERGADLFSHPLGALFFSFIEFLGDPSRTESLAASVAAGFQNFNIEQKAGLIRAIRGGKIGEAEKVIPELAGLQKDIAYCGAISYLVRAGEACGVTALAAREPLAAEVWRGIILLAENLAAAGGADDPKRLIEDLLSYRTSAGTKNIKIRLGVPDAQITIMTAHGSKGLEFDYVFIPYATEESWMSRGHGSYFLLPRESGQSDDVRDMRRLFYVALTRARKHIGIISPVDDGFGKPLLPLRFLDELASDQITRVELPPAAQDSATRALAEPLSRRLAECVEYSKRLLLERGLSVTALNHFKNCPSEFFLKSILKLPEPPSASAEKGNAMHEALACVWHLGDKSEKQIALTIENTVREYFDESLLPLFEKEAITKELVEASPLIAAALGYHVSQTGEIATEVWYERSFETNYDSKEVSLPLHGKLDALLETKDKALVFDYKTREAMSANAIKGETKNSDGNYFRQLIFYKILLGNNSRFKNKLVEPALVFLKPDDKGRCPIISVPVTEPDITRVQNEIQELVESVWSGKFLTENCDDKDCKFCALRKVM